MTTDKQLQEITKAIKALDKKLDTKIDNLDEKMQVGFKKLNEKLDREIEDVAKFQSKLDQAAEDHRKRIENIETNLDISTN